MVRPIPPEIIDTIIDLIALYRDTDSVDSESESLTVPRCLLGTCSLVARSWLPRSRLHLLDDIHITYSKYRNFSQLLESSLCTLVVYIKKLTLEDNPQSISPSEWFNDCLHLLTSLRSLESLTIFGGRFDILDTEHISNFLIYFPGLTQLKLDTCTFLSNAALVHVLRSSPHLKHITLWHIATTHFDSFNVSPPLRLTHLGASGRYEQRDFLQWLALRNLESLDTLSLRLLVGTSAAGLLSRILSSVGSSLKEFSLTYVDPGRFSNLDPESFRDLTLEANTRLSSFHFEFMQPMSLFAIADPIGILSLLLDGVISNELREITVALVLNTRVVIDTSLPSWEQFAQILERPNFSRLQRLVIMLQPEFIGRVRSWLTRRLPSLCSTGTVFCPGVEYWA